jgi:hypothetical protein
LIGVVDKMCIRSWLRLVDFLHWGAMENSIQGVLIFQEKERPRR